MIFEQEIGIDGAHRDTRHGGPRALNVVDQLVLGQVFAQHDFVADRKDVGMPCTGDLDSIAELDFVRIKVLRQPYADHGLETVLMRDAWRLLVALDARETPDPVCIWLDDAEPLADLVLADFGPWRLPLDVGAKRHSMDLVSQDRLEELELLRA